MPVLAYNIGNNLSNDTILKASFLPNSDRQKSDVIPPKDSATLINNAFLS
jgi:hypothetical protein